MFDFVIFEVLQYGLFTLNSKNKNLQEIINNVSKENAVCIHIRRGDMYSNLKMYLISVDYQKQAIKLANKLLTNPSFILSDSIDLAKKELNDLSNITFINRSTLEDFLIMSKCGNNIIANSTFSWWAAYLNRSSEHLTIAPFPRYTDSLLQTIFKDPQKREMKRKFYEQYAYPNDWISLNYN